MKNYGNLFWGMQFRTCKNFWEQRPQVYFYPKNFYKYKSYTAITSIAIRCTNLKAKFFVIARRLVAEAIHTKKRMDCHDLLSQVSQ